MCDGLGILPSAEAFEQALCFANGAPLPSEAGEGENGDAGAAPGLASALASDARDKLAKAVYSKLFKAVSAPSSFHFFRLIYFYALNAFFCVAWTPSKFFKL